MATITAMGPRKRVSRSWTAPTEKTPSQAMPSTSGVCPWTTPSSGPVTVQTRAATRAAQPARSGIARRKRRSSGELERVTLKGR
ncbi:hypothetical protein D3C74_322740 [compost metagenome]